MGPLEWAYAATWSLTAAWCLFVACFKDDWPAPWIEKLAIMARGVMFGSAATSVLWAFWGWPSW